MQPIPYEAQLEAWTCGAAALAMVYRSFGLPDAQSEIAQRLTPVITSGRRATPTHRLAADALDRGLMAVVLQVPGDWLAVSRCLEVGARCIVNHRLSDDRAAGHFSVLTELTAEGVNLHDPLRGPRRLDRGEFLRLWGDGMSSLAVPGQILVAIARSGQRLGPCPLCESDPPEPDRSCPTCGRAVPLQPLAVLGCTRKGCPMRAWDRAFCPWCDASWDEAPDR